MRRHGKSTNLGSSLDHLLKRLDRKSGGGLLQTRAAQAWYQMDGDSVSSHTTGAHLRDGEMVIYVDSSVWATELSALAEEYRTRINAEIGEESVRSMRFVVSRKVGEQRRVEQAEEESAAFYLEDKVESVPLTETERAQVEASAAQIGDEGLRRAVVAATIADLEWKKGLAKHKGR